MPSAGKPKRRGWKLAIAGLGFAIGGAAIAIGPGAAWLVDHLADGQRVWRLGRIDVDGVTGAWLGDLRAAHVTLRDEDGIWLDARDLRAQWRPLDLLSSAVRLDRGHAREIAVLRMPALSDPRPPSRVRIDVELREIDVAALRLDRAVVGEAASFGAALTLGVRDKQISELALSLQRTDSDADRLNAAYDRDYALDIQLAGAAGGVFAHALGAPAHEVSASATGQGNAEIGTMQFAVAVGEDSLLSASTRWSAVEWSLAAQAQLDRLPPLHTLARRIGAKISFDAAGVRAGRFDAHAESDFIALTMNGQVDDHFALAGPAAFVATTQRVSDIAREAPFLFGPARIEGELRRERGISAIRATLRARELDVLGQRTELSGPVQATLTPRSFTLSADLRAPAETSALFAQARLTTELSYDRARQRFSLDRAELASEALRVDARGWVNRGEGEFSGDWRVRRLGVLIPFLGGEAAGRWRALSEPGPSQRVWTTAVDGAGAAIGGHPAMVAQLLGATPQLDARVRYEDAGITVSRARLNGAQLRAGASGRIVRGNAQLALEASARGPLNLGAAEIAGAVDATGAISGPIVRPSLTARAIAAGFNAGGVVVERPILEVSLTPGPRAYAGHAELRGAVSGQALQAISDLAIANDALTLPTLDATIGALRVRGNAALGRDGPQAALLVSGGLDGLAPGLSGRIQGDLAYTPAALQLDARIADARAGELRIHSANLRAEGPPSALEARVDLVGRLREAPLTFAGAAHLAARERAALVEIEGAGALADTPFSTRSPMRARIADGEVDATLDIALGDGALTALWRERGRALSGSARVDNAPLAPLAAIWGERAQGRIGGVAALASSGRGLSGSADLALTGARFAGRQRGTLDMHVVGALQPNRLTAEIDASSSDGLAAHFQAEGPVVTNAAPIRIALAPERQGSARWSVTGPAESLWAAARLSDQTLSGQLSGQGELQFGAGSLSGDGHIEIVGGRFEDKLTAISLVDLDARIAIDGRGATIERFSAAGARGGTISAAGGSANPREGRVAIRVEDMRLVNRPDARAVASGDLTFAWEGLHSTLTGALDVSEAEIDAASSPDAGIPSIEVVEINRPGADDWPLPDDNQQPHRNGSTVLDVAIRAPGRVFTRGRGVDAEWSLDLRLDGTARNPRLYGEARAVRGTLALSGQPFEIEDARIFFNGDPLDAQIDLTAQRDSADLSARIRLTGTARAPEIAFSSTPALPEDEILPQILFGRGVEDLSPFEAAQLAASLAALSGRASLDLIDAARAAAGLDRFNVRQDEDGGFLVAGGVYLTRDVYVELARTGLGQAQSRVEWAVRPRLVLVTSFIGNGDQRVSLRWRRESD